MEDVDVLLEEAEEKDHDRKCEEISDLVSISEFKARCGALHVQFCGDRLLGASRQHLAAQMGLEWEQFEQVEWACQVEQLMPPGGLSLVMTLSRKDLPTDSSLESLSHPLQVKEALEKQFLPTLPIHTSSTPGEGELVQPPEVVLSIQVYHPTKKRRDCSYVVLGSQYLTELRDAILCCSDFFIRTDYSEDPDAFDRTIFKAPPHPSYSAFFFINNTFYNDLRHPMATELSKTIIEWSRENDRREMAPRIDAFSIGDMATTRFQDLSLRLGYPYLYSHHDNCEHLVIFDDLRMYHPADSQSRSDYPRVVRQHNRRCRKCDVCNVLGPSWVTVNDDLATVNPCFFCEDCFKKLHYTHEGKKICEFEAYPIHPDLLS